jgi:predicted enzyme related to lactoylglutathione lyase
MRTRTRDHRGSLDPCLDSITRSVAKFRFNDYGPEYAGIQNPQGGSAPEVGGLSKGQEVRSGGPLVLLYSTDLDRSVEAVQHAGGQVVNGPYAFPGGRRFHFSDPSGNELGVWGRGVARTAASGIWRQGTSRSRATNVPHQTDNPGI